eukprot:CAMPEP_0196766666 /NCGR_PEP_ID=MMETSP1095-20130614/28365_1 /TAXON_ID=96789 ORGANISM="Chromulina nebulosa, Strain UTEXLB2642" /NCGR_SAMPLE_ID=MMETSP1095 /ASSEMBLY_ACC=CAM_ASM_000446 /LENGTH=416 /DNA_ID=CAMNT_0042130007 /DNA_START=172 /DNA_END=1422 /DNA_ORIENTATION=-
MALKSNSSNRYSKTFKSSKLPTTIEDDDISENSSDSSIYNSNDEEILLVEELSADYIGKRAIDISNLIYLIENYYALNGMSHPMARYEALLSILGYNDNDYEEYVIKKNDDTISNSDINSGLNSAKTSARASSRQGINRSTSKDELSNSKQIRAIDKEPLVNKLSEIMSMITDKIGLYFQKQFSKYIKVINIPKVSSIIARLEESTALASLALNKNGIAGLASFVNGLSPTLREKQSLEDMILKMNKGYDDNEFIDTYDVNGVIIKLGYDGSGYAMHNTNIISKIFDQDRKYNILDDQDATNNEMNGGDILDETIDDEWLENIDQMLDDNISEHSTNSINSDMLQDDNNNNNEVINDNVNTAEISIDNLIKFAMTKVESMNSYISNSDESSNDSNNDNNDDFIDPNRLTAMTDKID